MNNRWLAPAYVAVAALAWSLGATPALAEATAVPADEPLDLGGQRFVAKRRTVQKGFRPGVEAMP